MDIKTIIEKSLERMESFDVNSVLKYFNKESPLEIGHGLGDISRKADIGNYSWFPGFIDLLKPTQVVELGSAMGVADICMLASPYRAFELFGITLKERGLEFCYIKKEQHPNFHPIVGNYMDLSIWPKNIDLKKTDFWYIDGLHQGKHVTEQIKLYKPFFKPGTIIAFDDIFMSPDMAEMWHGLDDILDIKYKTTLPLHFTGFGLIQIGDKI